MVAVWITLTVVALVLLLVCGALVELYRGVGQIRAGIGLLDIRNKLDVPTDGVISAAPDIPEGVLTAEWALLLVLSDHCHTCDLLAERLAGGPPDHVWITVVSYNAESASAWLRSHDLDSTSQVIIDTEERILNILGTRVTPAGLRLHLGRVVAAHTIPSTRTLQEELAWARKGGVVEPEYASGTRSAIR